MLHRRLELVATGYHRIAQGVERVAQGALGGQRPRLLLRREDADTLNGSEVSEWEVSAFDTNFTKLRRYHYRLISKFWPISRAYHSYEPGLNHIPTLVGTLVPTQVKILGNIGQNEFYLGTCTRYLVESVPAV